MSNPNGAVEHFLQELDHPLKAEVVALRSLILASDPQITERIKWNAPSFGYGGDDRVTFRLGRKDRLQLIFHRGAKVKDSSGFSFEDETGLLEWAAADRGVLTLQDMTELTAKEEAILSLVRKWMAATRA